MPRVVWRAPVRPDPVKTFFVLLGKFLCGALWGLSLCVLLWWLTDIALGSTGRDRELSAWDRRELSRDLATAATRLRHAASRRQEVRALIDHTLAGRSLSAYQRRSLAREVARQVDARDPSPARRDDIRDALVRGVNDSSLRAYDRRQFAAEIGEEIERNASRPRGIRDAHRRHADQAPVRR